MLFVEQAGWAPLHYAAGGGHLTAIELLLKHSANVNARSKVYIVDYMPSSNILSVLKCQHNSKYEGNVFDAACLHFLS